MDALARLLILLLLTGCGYHFAGQGGTLPGGVTQLQIPLVVNRSAEPLLENRLTDRLREVFARHPQIIQVDERDAAEARLLVVIEEYRSRALSYDSNDNISEYRANLIVDVTLEGTRPQQKLWSNRLNWTSDFSASADKGFQENLEDQAISEVTLRLAEDILYRLVDDF